MTYEAFIERYKYDIKTDLLGQGGFGKVFKAYDQILDRVVAIKVSEVKPGFESQRLRRELEIASALPPHSNIARYEECMTFRTPLGEYDFGILQYYPEGNLLQFLNNEMIPAGHLRNLCEGLLQGIKFLHDHHIVHRDLKPQNILIVKRNDVIVPKITDFGISKHYTPGDQSAILNSLTGGTLAYSSPELIKGYKYIHANADLWSFGVIVYQLCTGELPFSCGEYESGSERGRMEMARQITDGVIPENIGSISQAYGELISRCLVVNPENRIKTAADCLSILKDPFVALKQSKPKPEKPPPQTAPEKPGPNPVGNAPGPNYGGETMPGGADHNDRLPEQPPPAKNKEDDPILEIYGGLTKPKVEIPVVPGRGDEPPSPPGKPDESPPAGIRSASPLPPPPSEPPDIPEKPAKKPGGRHSRRGWIIALFVIIGIVITIIWWFNRGISAKEVEEKRIADSTRVADSLAMVQAEQQRIADSIAKAQNELRITDSMAYVRSPANMTKTPPNLPAMTEARTSPVSTVPEIEMVYVAGGTFQMGSNDGNSDEKPVHQVTVSSFYIGKYEVTRKEWREVMGSAPVQPYNKSCEDCPIAAVSWYDVRKFIMRLNELTGKNYRLPTEAEWEYAAKGGVQSKGYLYAGSNKLSDVAWPDENSGSKSQTHPVGQKRPNELGIYDMSGNVWEWCADWYDRNFYSISQIKNPKNSVPGSQRVCRDGCFAYYLEDNRITLRYAFEPDYRHYFLGFRLLRME